MSFVLNNVDVNLPLLTCSFNDRMRDAVLGGSPFGNPLQQGFVTGLSLEVDVTAILSSFAAIGFCFLVVNGFIFVFKIRNYLFPMNSVILLL